MPRAAPARRVRVRPGPADASADACKRSERGHTAADGDETGDLPATLSKGYRLAFLVLWPHARPWRVARPEPMLRCVPQAEQVAELLTRAWVQCTGGQKAAQAAEGAEAGHGREPALATH